MNGIPSERRDECPPDGRRRAARHGQGKSSVPGAPEIRRVAGQRHQVERADCLRARPERLAAVVPVKVGQRSCVGMGCRVVLPSAIPVRGRRVVRHRAA